MCVLLSVVFTVGKKKVIAGLVFIQRFDSLLYDPFFQRNTQSRMQRRYIFTTQPFFLKNAHSTKVKKLQFCFFPLAEKILWKLAQIGNPTGQNPLFSFTQ